MKGREYTPDQPYAVLWEIDDEQLERMAKAATASHLAILIKRGIPIPDENKAYWQEAIDDRKRAADHEDFLLDEARDKAKREKRRRWKARFEADQSKDERDEPMTKPMMITWWPSTPHGTRQRPPSLRSMFDITHDVDAELSWQADGMTPHGGVMLFAGGKSAGKSTLARQYALAVARGEPFLGREVPNKALLSSRASKTRKVWSSEHWRQIGLREDDPIHGWDGALPDEAASWLYMGSTMRSTPPWCSLTASAGGREVRPA